MTTRERIYEKLGLPFGSLNEEGGNDWIRALAEVEDEDKQEYFKNNKYSENCEFISKESSLYLSIMNSDIKKRICEKIEIARRKDLEIYEVDYLFLSNDKDVVLNLIRNNYLNDIQKEYVLKNGTYLCKKFLQEIKGN